MNIINRENRRAALGFFIGGIVNLIACNVCLFFHPKVLALALEGTIVGGGLFTLGACLWTWHERGSGKWQKLILPFVIALIASLAAQLLFLNHQPIFSYATEAFSLFMLGYGLAKMRQIFTQTRSREEATRDYIVALLENNQTECQKIIQQYPEMSEKISKKSDAATLLKLLIDLGFEDTFIKIVKNYVSDDKVFALIRERFDQAFNVADIKKIAALIASDSRVAFFKKLEDILDVNIHMLIKEAQRILPPPISPCPQT